MNKLRSLQTFIAISEAGSLSAAAVRMQTSLQSVMRALADLESAVGMRLVQRTTRRMAITEEGRVYLERVKRVLADLDDADAELRSGKSVPQGTLSVSAPVLFGQMHVVNCVQRFIERNPGISVKLALTDRVCHLVEEGIDVAIRIGELPDSTLVAHPLATLRHVVVASPKHLQAVGMPKTPMALTTANCLRFVGPHAGAWQFKLKGETIAVPVGGNFESNLVSPLLDACARGMGFARVQSYQAAPYLRSGRLREVLAKHAPDPHEVSVVHLGRRLQPAKVRSFVQLLQQELARELGSAELSRVRA